MKAADNGFHIPDAFDPSGKFGFWGIGKRKYMKSITDAKKFTEKRPGNIVDKFPIMAAHILGSINKYDKIDGTVGIPGAAGLLLTVGKQHNQQGEQDKVYYLFHNNMFLSSKAKRTGLDTNRHENQTRKYPAPYMRSFHRPRKNQNFPQLFYLEWPRRMGKGRR